LEEQAAVLELAPVLVRDMESRIVLWTKGAERLYGYSNAEALGRVSHSCFRPNLLKGRSMRTKCCAALANGKGNWCAANATASG
jgi:PAS domain-containing protein